MTRRNAGAPLLVEPWKLERAACERNNAITHAVGLALSFPAVYWLVKQTQTAADFVSCLVYGLTLIGIYAASTGLHFAVGRREHRHLEILDHAAIYLIIAGTFTPFLVRVGGTFGALMLAGGWAMATAGVVFKIIFGLRYWRLSIASYLVMGWFPLTALRPILHATSTGAVEWLLIGGLAYTAGVPFFLAARQQPRLHAVWHLFVMLGSAGHFIAVWLAISR